MQNLHHYQNISLCYRQVTCLNTQQGDPRKYQTYLATRPKSFEANAVALLIDVLRKSKDQPMKPGFALHIVHLANADLLPDIKQAQDEGQPLQLPATALPIMLLLLNVDPRLLLFLQLHCTPRRICCC